MSRSRESRPRGSRKQQTKITFAARTRTLNRFKKNYHGAQGFAFLAHSLLKSHNSKGRKRIPVVKTLNDSSVLVSWQAKNED